MGKIKNIKSIDLANLPQQIYLDPVYQIKKVERKKKKKEDVNDNCMLKWIENVVPQIIERVVKKPVVKYRYKEETETVIIQKKIEVPRYVIKEKTVFKPKVEIIKKYVEVPKIIQVQKIVKVPKVVEREVIIDKIVECPKYEVEYKTRYIAVPRFKYKHIIKDTIIPFDTEKVVYKEIPIYVPKYWEKFAYVPKIQPKFKLTPHFQVTQENLPIKTLQIENPYHIQLSKNVSQTVSVHPKITFELPYCRFQTKPKPVVEIQKNLSTYPVIIKQEPVVKTANSYVPLSKWVPPKSYDEKSLYH